MTAEKLPAAELRNPLTTAEYKLATELDWPPIMNEKLDPLVIRFALPPPKKEFVAVEAIVFADPPTMILFRLRLLLVLLVPERL
jgi:hypothetical protein